MNNNQIALIELIRTKIKTGFASVEDIIEETIEYLEDQGWEEEISEDWINDRVTEEYKKRVEESKGWIQPTDPEKLSKAFDQLCKEKIIALHCAGYTTSDGESDVIEIHSELLDMGIESTGYCFYHQQDFDRAIDPHQKSLLIAFQKVNNKKEEETLRVGKQVTRILKENGLNVNWNGNANEKIEIVNIEWNNVYENDGDAWNHYRVLELMENKTKH
jgi:hypothetical protein